MAKRAFREVDVLEQLDRHAAGFDFPTLDNGYIYPIDARLTAYRDARRWALVIEHIGYFYRAFSFANALYAYGNGLLTEAGHGEMIGLLDTPEERWCVPDTGRDVNPALRSVRVRGTTVRLTESDRAPATDETGRGVRGLPIEVLFRRLLPRCRDLFLATEDELRAVVPADLPQVLRLDEWEHSDAVHDVLPSHTECFPMLARVLVTGDVSHYKPTKPPNTHWSNWPTGGTL